MTCYTVIFSQPYISNICCSNFSGWYETREEAIDAAKQYGGKHPHQSATVLDSDGNKIYSTQEQKP